MKLVFTATLEEVKGKKDRGFKWILESGEDSLLEAGQAMALVQSQHILNVTLEIPHAAQ